LRRIFLIDAAEVARRTRGRFWHPSQAILARLRKPSEAQLRVVEGDDENGANLWDSTPLWVALTNAGRVTCTGQLVVSSVEASGYRVGDDIRFTKDQIFDVWELNKNG
jgi:hypothetical protein